MDKKKYNKYNNKKKLDCPLASAFQWTARPPDVHGVVGKCARAFDSTQGLLSPQTRPAGQCWILIGANAASTPDTNYSLMNIAQIHPHAVSISLLVLSNVFMTFAWYAHLRDLSARPWYIAVAVSWGIALLEYCFQVPANRIGYTVMSIAQLKIIQEVITLCVFVPFAYFYMREAPKWDYLWAALCIVGAVFFVFRGK